MDFGQIMMLQNEEGATILNIVSKAMELIIETVKRMAIPTAIATPPRQLFMISIAQDDGCLTRLNIAGTV
jgi:hypothetical protein